MKQLRHEIQKCTPTTTDSVPDGGGRLKSEKAAGLYHVKDMVCINLLISMKNVTFEHVESY